MFVCFVSYKWSTWGEEGSHVIRSFARIVGHTTTGKKKKQNGLILKFSYLLS